MRESVYGVCESECVCVCERECMCVRDRGGSVYVCVYVCERERECVVCVTAYECVSH